MRIAVLSPVWFPVPPTGYGGIEWVVWLLADGLVDAGHEVTLFAPGDSEVECEVVPTVPRSLWTTGYRGDLSAHINVTLAKAWAQHDRFEEKKARVRCCRTRPLVAACRKAAAGPAVAPSWLLARSSAHLAGASPCRQSLTRGRREHA
jgi:hypothetical protein